MSRGIRAAQERDHGQIFTLQRASFVDEARLYETPFVPALDETFEEFQLRMQASESWIAVHDERVVGAVSLRPSQRVLPHIERLMVAPDCRGQGIASVLLQIVEDQARAKGHNALQLIVGDLAVANRSIYAHLGWVESSCYWSREFKDVAYRTMTKHLSP